MLTGPRFLLYAQGGYSDRLRAVPFVRAIREANPTASIAILGYEPGRELWEGCPHVDEFVCLGAAPVLGRGRLVQLRKAALAVRTARGRRGHHDIFVNLSVMPAGLFPGLLSVLSGIPKRVGYGGPGAGVNVTPGLADMRIPYETRTATLLDHLAIEATDLRLEAWCSAEDRAAVARMLEEQPRGAGGPTVVCHPSSDWSCQMWPAARWAQVIDALASRHRCRVVLSGTAEERAFTDEIVSLSSESVTDLVGRTSHGQLTALVEQADLVLTLDTLIAPLARAMGTEVVTLMAADTPNWSPRRLVELGALGITASSSDDHPWSVRCKWRRTGVVERCQSSSCVGVHGMGGITTESILAQISARFRARLEIVPSLAAADGN